MKTRRLTKKEMWIFAIGQLDWSTLSGKCALNGHVQCGKMVYMGCGVLVAPSKRIGDGATVGIGSVVISNVKAGTTVFGNPAKKMDL